MRRPWVQVAKNKEPSNQKSDLLSLLQELATGSDLCVSRIVSGVVRD